MSGWRRKALELFPERTSDVQRAFSVYDLFFSLLTELRQAYAAEPPDQARIDRIFNFAAWCHGPRQHCDLRNAAAVGFYEHVPYVGADARRELATRLSATELAELEPLFRQMLEEPIYTALHAELERAHGRQADRG